LAGQGGVAWANAVGRAIGVEDLEILRSLISQVTKASRNYRPNPAQ